MPHTCTLQQTAAVIPFYREYGKEGNGKLKRTAETDDGKWAWSRIDG